MEIVKRSDHAKGFVVLPKRWVVERTFAWLGRCRRLAKDWENLNRKALAFLRLASIKIMLRKLCNPLTLVGFPRGLARIVIPPMRDAIKDTDELRRGAAPVGVGLESNACYRAEPIILMPSRGCICW